MSRSTEIPDRNCNFVDSCEDMTPMPFVPRKQRSLLQPPSTASSAIHDFSLGHGNANRRTERLQSHTFRAARFGCVFHVSSMTEHTNFFLGLPFAFQRRKKSDGEDIRLPRQWYSLRDEHTCFLAWSVYGGCSCEILECSVSPVASKF